MAVVTRLKFLYHAKISDLIESSLDPAVPRLFIIDGSKRLAKAIA
jgi:hypothetical protein